MERNEILAGTAIAVLAAVGVGQLYLDKGAMKTPEPVGQAQTQPQTPQEVRPISIDEVVSGFMTSLEQGEDTSKLVALTGLLDELESPAFANAVMSADTAEPFAKAAIAAVTVSTEAETPEIAELRRRAAGFIAARTHGPSSKEWILKLLDEGGAEIRAEIVRNIGRPHGVRGKAVYEKLVAIGDKIPTKDLAPALVRLGGKKAGEPIVARMKASDDWKEIGACVTALQDIGEPELLGAAFERLDQTGLLEKGEKLPWISGTMFSAFIEKAEGANLRNGLRAAKTRPALVKHAVDAVKRGLDSSDPQTRLVAAAAVTKGVVAKVITIEDGEKMLSGRLSAETEPVLKAELTGGLDHLRGLIPQSPVGQQ
jgi:hypothetical protein